VVGRGQGNCLRPQSSALLHQVLLHLGLVPRPMASSEMNTQEDNIVSQSAIVLAEFYANIYV
jgi:hypothetical protein